MKRFILTSFVILSFASCAKNPFATRDSDEPTTQAGTFIPPTTPQLVLENLRLSYGELVIGNFTQCLDSAFLFRFDFIEGAETDSSWGIGTEINLTENMFNDFRAAKTTRSLRISFEPIVDQPDVVIDSNATLVRNYTVSIVDSVTADTTQYRGVAKYSLVESAFNFWSLSRWEALHLNLQTKSWGELKHAYR
jgi:hypothetical protein